LRKSLLLQKIKNWIRITSYLINKINLEIDAGPDSPDPDDYLLNVRHSKIYEKIEKEHVAKVLSEEKAEPLSHPFTENLMKKGRLRSNSVNKTAKEKKKSRNVRRNTINNKLLDNEDIKDLRK
jgi:hypothetical protein